MSKATSGANDSRWTNPHIDEIDQLDKRIRDHPGRRLADRLERLKRTLEAWIGFSRGLSELLGEYENEPKVHTELMRNVGDRTKQSVLIRLLDQNIIAYTAGLGAVIDQARAVAQAQNRFIQDAYAARTKEIVENHPAAPFLWKLRNHVLHNIAAPWHFSGSFEEDGSSSCTVSLDTELLLEDKKSWNKEAKDFIRDSGDTIQLSPLIDPYLHAMVNHIGRLLPEVMQANIASVRACDELIKKRNLLLSGGVTDGSDWEERIAHLEENIRRQDRGELPTDFRTGLPIQKGKEVSD